VDVFGVEAGGFELGAELTPAVDAATDRLVELLLAELSTPAVPS
jgi:hypothetical protein